MDAEEVLHRLEERAARQEEDNVSESIRIKTIQEDRKFYRDALMEGTDLSYHQANILIMELEKRADVYGEVRRLRL